MSGMQQHMQSVQNPVVKCKACKPKAQYKIINTPGPTKANNVYIYIYSILYILVIMQRKHVNKHTRTHTPKDSITLCQDGGLTVIEHDGAGRLPLVVVIAVASPPFAAIGVVVVAAPPPCCHYVIAMSSPCRRHVVAMSSPCRRNVVAMLWPCRCHAVAL